MSYKDNPMYGRMKQKEAAIRSGANMAVAQPAYTPVDQAFEADQQQRNIQLKQMGMQQKQFERGLAESKRQFDVSSKERERQFSINLGVAYQGLKDRRKANKKAEFLGLFNIALGVGTGLTEHIMKNRQLRYQQETMQLMNTYMKSNISRGASA